MAHMVEQMFYAGETPWHGLGNEISGDDVYDIHVGIKKAGLDWTVKLKKLYIEEECFTNDLMPVRYQIRREMPAGDRYATVRSDNDFILGTVGPRYTPLQNDTAFDWFTPFLESKSAKLHTAGSLDDGRKVWVLAQLALDNAEIVGGDEVAKFILLSNSHDGTLAVRVGFTPIRVVCANTLRMAHNDDATKLIRIRHHKTVEKTLEKVREVMNLANQEFEATADQYRFLASRPINSVDLQTYIKIVLKVKEEKDKPLPTRTLNTIEEIVKKFESGIGSNIPGVRGTYWGAYNAYTEYLNYDRGNKKDTRMDSLWFGEYAKDNERALVTALEMANAV